MRTIKTNLYLLFVSALICAGTAMAQSPSIFFTDLTSGPATGGENGAGAYVTVYGNNLGSSPSVTVGGVTATVKLAPSSYFWYQKMTIQIPASAPSGATTIQVGGSSNTLPFTVQSGNIYFVSTTGSDSNSGSASAPWKTLLKARGAVKAGDIVYDTGVSQTADDGNGWNSSFSIHPADQNEAVGTAASPVAFVVYPGSSATIGGSDPYGIGTGDGAAYYTFAGFTLRAQTSAVTISGSGYRFVGNDISSPNQGSQKGCFSSNIVSGVEFLGNNVHNCGGPNSDKEDHAVYFSTDVNHVEEAWNSIHDNQTCYGTQFNSSPLSTGTGMNQYDLHVHDNEFFNQVCAAVNFSTIDPSKGVVEFYNNVVHHVGTSVALNGGGGYPACLYVPGGVNTGSVGSGTLQVYNNSFYDCGPNDFDINDLAHKVNLTNNIVYALSGEAYYMTETGSTALQGTNNIWFGAGNGPSQTSSNVNADPKFISTSTPNFHLQSSSPAISAGLAIGAMGITVALTGGTAAYDHDGIARPLTTASDLGAYQFSTTTVSNPKPAPPTNLSLTVQ